MERMGDHILVHVVAQISVVSRPDVFVNSLQLNENQRQTVSEYCDLKGEEYVRSKLEIIRAQSFRNPAGALLAALEDDRQPSVSTRGEKGATRQKPVRSGNRNIGNSNEHCDFSQYRCSQ